MDILLQDTDELPVYRQGDFEANENTDFQHIRHILQAEQGELREFPLAGAGLRRQRNASVATDEVRRNCLLQLQRDGYRVDKLNITPSQDRWEVDYEGERLAYK